MFSNNAIEQREVGAGHLACPREHVIVMANGDFTEKLSHRRIGNSDVLARVQILAAAVAIAFDDPPEAQSRKRERLREIPDHGGTRKTRSGIGLAAVVNRVKHFVGYKLNSALDAKIVQLPHLFVAQRRAGGVVRGVHDQDFRVEVGQAFHLIEIDAVGIFAGQVIGADLDSKGFGNRLVRRKTWKWNDGVRAGLRCAVEDVEQGFG